MDKKRISLGSESLNANLYKIWFRCSNCGVIFETLLRKGQGASSLQSPCPHCGVKPGTPGIGNFTTVKYNPEIDQMPQRHYFK